MQIKRIELTELLAALKSLKTPTGELRDKMIDNYLAVNKAIGTIESENRDIIALLRQQTGYTEEMAASVEAAEREHIDTGREYTQEEVEARRIAFRFIGEVERTRIRRENETVEVPVRTASIEEVKQIAQNDQLSFQHELLFRQYLATE